MWTASLLHTLAKLNAVLTATIHAPFCHFTRSRNAKSVDGGNVNFQNCRNVTDRISFASQLFSEFSLFRCQRPGAAKPHAALLSSNSASGGPRANQVAFEFSVLRRTA